MLRIGLMVLLCIDAGSALQATSGGGPDDAVEARLAEYRAASAVDPSGVAAAVAANELGLAYQNAGRLAESERYYQAALRVLKLQHPRQALTVVNNLASLYLETGQFARAERLHLEQLREEAKDDPSNHERLLFNIATLNQARGRLAEAESLFSDLLTRYETRQQQLDVAITLNSLGLIALRRGETALAAAQLARAAALMQNGTNWLLPRCLANLALAYAAAGLVNQAKNTCAKAITIAEDTWGPVSPALPAVLAVCSGALQKSGLKTEARLWKQRAQRIQRESGAIDSRGLVIDIADMLPAKAAAAQAR